MRQPTIRDVAEKAGVSKSLVSLVMNNSPRVSEDSRSAVLTAASELGYRRNALARSLVSQRSNMVGVVMSGPHDVFHNEVLEGIDSHTRLEDFTPLVLHGYHQAELEDEVVETFLELRVDSLILLGTVLPINALEKAASVVPLVVVTRQAVGKFFDVVSGDDKLGAQRVVDHLVELGHKRIVHIDGGARGSAPHRANGYRAAMEAHGLEPRVFRGSFTQEGGADGAKAALKQGSATAIFAANDLAGLGAREVILEQDMRIPGDISLVGYGNTKPSSLRGIELTSVGQPGRKMGETAAALAVERVHSGRVEPRQVIFEPTLVVRNSTGAPPAA